MLEPLNKDDFEVVSRWVSDPVDHVKICGNMFTYPLSADRYIRYFVEDAGDPERRLCFKFIHEGNVVGMASFSRIDRTNDYGHIGFVAIDPSLRGTGIGATMLQELLQKGFRELSFNRIDLVVIESNEKAFSFYTKKMGFRNEGLIRDIIKAENGYLSWYSLSMLKNEWQEGATSTGNSAALHSRR